MATLFSICALAIACALVRAQGPEPAPCVSLVDAITQNGLSRLGDAVLSVVGETSAASLAGVATIQVEAPDDTKVTIFAPADAAWPPVEDLPEGGDLVDVLFGHLLDEYLPASAIQEAFDGVGGGDLTLETSAQVPATATLDGEDIYIAIAGQAPPGAKVIETDIETCVGVIHIIDALLIPGGAMGPDAMGPDAMSPDAMAPGDDLSSIDIAPMPFESPLDPTTTLGDATAPLSDSGAVETTDSNGALSEGSAGEGAVVGEDPSGAVQTFLSSVIPVLAVAVSLLM